MEARKAASFTSPGSPSHSLPHMHMPPKENSGAGVPEALLEGDESSIGYLVLHSNAPPNFVA